MNELNVQKVLRDKTHTPESLKKTLGINCNEKDNLILFNYSQIDSPKTDPIVTECRGLILEKDTWNVVFLPFIRFFNYGEALDYVQQNIDINGDFFKNAYLIEKIDGSLIGVWNYKGKWRISTRGVIDASGTLPTSLENPDKTFKDLFYETVNGQTLFESLNPEYTYTFELVSLENRNISIYSKKDLYLLGIRHQATLMEQDPYFIQQESYTMQIRTPEIYRIDDVETALKKAASVGLMEEGFVCVNYNYRMPNGFEFPRLKIKNRDFVALSHLKESITSSLTGLLRVVVNSEYTEFLSYFPEYTDTVNKILDKYTEFVRELEVIWNSCKAIEDRKEFALQACKSKCPSILFKMYDDRSKTVKGIIEEQFNDEIHWKNFAKNLLKVLNLKGD